MKQEQIDQIRADFEQDYSELMGTPESVIKTLRNDDGGYIETECNRLDFAWCIWQAAHAKYSGGGEAVAVVYRNESGQISLIATDGEHFDMSKHIGARLYTNSTPAVPDSTAKDAENFRKLEAMFAKLKLSRCEDILNSFGLYDADAAGPLAKAIASKKSK